MLITFRTWVFPNQFGKSEIEILIWECPKSDSEQNRVWSTTESRKATLADCFLSLARLAATLKKLSSSFNVTFRKYCIKVINERYDEFDNDLYITCFFLDPRFRAALLKKCALKRVLRCATSISKRMGFDHYEADTLCGQIRKYINEEESFDLDIGYAKDGVIN